MMWYIGVDVGGTNIAVGLVDQDGKMAASKSVPTRAERPMDQVLDDLAQTVRDVAQHAGGMEQIQGVGLGLPGVVDVKTGLLIFAENLGWHKVEICKEVNRRLGVPVYAGNDANVAALAEARAGAGHGVESAVMLTLGTGLGGGIIIDGKIYTGAHYVAGEIGHMVLEVGGRQCNCGVRGCFERYASATALIAAGREAMRQNPTCAIARAANGDPEQVTARVVVDAARTGEHLAVAIWEEYLNYLLNGMVTLVNMYDPEVFIIGGGVSAAGDFLLQPLRQRLPNMVSFRNAGQARIELATLGNDAGIIGAALLCVAG